MKRSRSRKASCASSALHRIVRLCCCFCPVWKYINVLGAVCVPYTYASVSAAGVSRVKPLQSLVLSSKRFHLSHAEEGFENQDTYAMACSEKGQGQSFPKARGSSEKVSENPVCSRCATCAQNQTRTEGRIRPEVRRHAYQRFDLQPSQDKDFGYVEELSSLWWQRPEALEVLHGQGGVCPMLHQEGLHETHAASRLPSHLLPRSWK